MIKDNYLRIKELLSDDTLLVVVSKGVSVEKILQCYAAGARDFGESRWQEFLAKRDLLPSDIKWHMIGSVQSKKVAKMAGQFELIHSVDSLELARKMESRGVRMRVLLEANTSGEKAKHGLSPEEWLESGEELMGFKNIIIDGLMTVAPLTEEENVIRNCFRNLRKLRDALWRGGAPLKQLSMGMSHDWKIALEEGATILRIGTSIFKNNGI